MQSIPLAAIPSQTVKAVLGGQNCQISVWQKSQGLFVDVISNDVAIVSGVVARYADFLICREYLGFLGNMLFIDNQGADDPVYTGLGSRFELVYLTADEYALVV